MRYFFHTYDNGKISPDADGFEFADDTAARYEASRFLSEMAAELIPQDADQRYAVEVIDENGRAITTVGFTIQDGPEAIV